MIIPQIICYSPNSSEIFREAQRFVSAAQDSDDLEDLVRTFSGFRVDPGTVKLFNLVSDASRSMGEFVKNTKALRVLTLDSGATERLLGFLEAFAGRTDSIEHLHTLMSFIGTTPEDIVSRDHSEDIFDSMNEIVQNCEAEQCVEAAAGFFQGVDASGGSDNNVRKILESYKAMMVSVNDEASKEAMFGAPSAILEASRSSTELFTNLTNVMGGWVSGKSGEELRNSSKAVGIAMKVVGEKMKDKNKRHLVSDNDGFTDIIKPLLKNLGVVPLGADTPEEWAKFENFTKKFSNPEKDMLDMQDCVSAFERLGRNEKVKEFFEVAEVFNYSDVYLGHVASAILEIGDVAHVGALPGIVADFGKDLLDQVGVQAKVVPKILELPGGVKGLTGVLKTLGVKKLKDLLGNGTSLLDSDSEALQKLQNALESLIKSKTWPLIQGALNHPNITLRISRFLTSLPSITPISGLLNLTQAVEDLPEGPQTIARLADIMTRMGKIPDALETVRDLPIAMNMPGCGEEGQASFRKVHDTYGEISEDQKRDRKDQLMALNFIAMITELYQRLPNGEETLEAIAGHLDPLTQLSFKPIGRILEDVDSEDLFTLLPSLLKILSAINGSEPLEVVIGQLAMVRGELAVFNGMNEVEILKKLRDVLGEPTTTLRPQALVFRMSCFKPSGPCQAYCAMMAPPKASITLNIALGALALVMLVIAVIIWIWRRVKSCPQSYPNSADIEIAFTSCSDSESVSSLASMKQDSTVSQIQPTGKSKNIVKKSAAESPDSKTSPMTLSSPQVKQSPQ